MNDRTKRDDARLTTDLLEGDRGFDSRRLHHDHGQLDLDFSAGAQPVPGCRECGGPLPTSRPVYCSDACKRRWRLDHRHVRTRKLCELCNRLADMLPSSRFCSWECAGLFKQRTGALAGANNPRWIGGVSRDNMRYRRRQIERWPEREAARRAVSRAIRAGRLTRLPCEACGDPKSHGHHDDYSKPLLVRWLCRTHHDEHHRADSPQPPAPTAET